MDANEGQPLPGGHYEPVARDDSDEQQAMLGEAEGGSAHAE